MRVKLQRLALASLLSVPVIVGLGAPVSAGPVPDPEPQIDVTTGCEGDKFFITIVIENAGNSNFSAHIKPSGESWNIDVTGNVAVFNKKQSHNSWEQITDFGRPSVAPGKRSIAAGASYDVIVVADGGGNDAPPLPSTFDVTLPSSPCEATQDPDPIVNVSAVCSGPNSPGISVTWDNQDGSPGSGPKYDLYISADGEPVEFGPDDQKANNQSDLDQTFDTGRGTFQVVVRGNGKSTSVFNDFVNVSCRRTSGGRPSTPTTPLLPTTGSDSSTSLLILAPAMMALGGGLVLARRRMVKA